MKMLLNKVIWITGASSGIGKELAMQLASANNKLVLSARNIKALEETAAACLKMGSEVLLLPLDLEKLDEPEKYLQQVLDKFGKVDVLINNGGVSQRSFAADTEMPVTRRLMEINFFGTVALSQLVLKEMLAGNGGNIAVISSLSGKFGWPQRAVYAASKHALQGYFETLIAETYNTNVKVTIISPGRINTPISVSALTGNGDKHNQYDEGQKNGISVEVCAAKIIDAIAHSKKQVIIARSEKLLYWIHWFFPWLYYRIASKVNPN